MYIEWRNQFLKDEKSKSSIEREENQKLYIVINESTLSFYCFDTAIAIAKRFSKMYFANLTNFLIMFAEFLNDICRFEKCTQK